jgi:GTP cyclohydrolase IA
MSGAWHSPLVYLVRNGKDVPMGELDPETLKRLTENSDGVISIKEFPRNDGGSFYPVRTPEQAAEALLIMLGVYHYGDTDSHMARTPQRFVQSLKELTTPGDKWKFTTFPATSDEMVVVAQIPFYTLCAHHVIPFYGHAHIGYVPDKKIAGLSKFARLVKQASKGLWVQEELTATIATSLETHLQPRGVAVLLEGEHMCMSMRGVQTPGTITTTSAMRGVFGDHSRTAKQEFMQIIAPRRKGNG